jgi:hypothetical protein
MYANINYTAYLKYIYYSHKVMAFRKIVETELCAENWNGKIYLITKRKLSFQGKFAAQLHRTFLHVRLSAKYQFMLTFHGHFNSAGHCIKSAYK